MTLQDQNELADALREARGEMAGLRAEINGSLIDLEKDLGQSITLTSGGILPCIPTMEFNGSALIVGGFEEIVDVSVRVRVEHFVTTGERDIPTGTTVLFTGHDVVDPRSGKKMLFRGKSLRVLSMELDGLKAFYVVKLGSAK